jgi:hypothetical protein
MKINLRIERIVLDGVTVGDTRQFSLAVERELRNALVTQGLAPGLRNGATLSKLTIPGPVSHRQDRPELLARSLGRVVSGSIGTPSQRPTPKAGADR